MERTWIVLHFSSIPTVKGSTIHHYQSCHLGAFISLLSIIHQLLGYIITYAIKNAIRSSVNLLRVSSSSRSTKSVVKWVVRVACWVYGFTTLRDSTASGGTSCQLSLDLLCCTDTYKEERAIIDTYYCLHM